MTISEESLQNRSLLVRGFGCEFMLYVPTSLWPVAERIREDYKTTIAKVPTKGADLPTVFNELELLLHFMNHSRELVVLAENGSSGLKFLTLIFEHLHEKYLKGSQVHGCLQKNLNVMNLRDGLRFYFQVKSLLDQEGSKYFSKPALLNAVVEDKVVLQAIFGGQGISKDILYELQDILYTYEPFVQPLLNLVAAQLKLDAEDPEARDYLPKGLDVLKWISMDFAERPSGQYLELAAISLPLVGLVQLLNYYVACKIYSVDPKTMANMYNGVTGHSQGIVSAAVLSTSSSFTDLEDNTISACRILFWIGLRALQAFPATALDPKIIQDSLAHDEGQPSPMLSVSGLTLEQLQTQVNVSNQFLSPSEQIEISLYNGPRAFVCVGPPKSLYGLNLLLRKIRAAAGENQARIPFSERKYKFVNRFLPISSPFHSQYLKGVTEKLIGDNERFDLCLRGSAHVPIINTETGIT